MDRRTVRRGDHAERPRTGPGPRSTALPPGQPLRLIKFVAYGWSSQRSLPALRDQVAAGAARRARTTGWDGLLAEQRAYLDDVLGRRRRRARRRRRGAAGGPVRDVPRAPGRGPGRAAGDPGQGPDRPRLRRARVLGHRDVRPAGARPTAAGRRGRRAALAAVDARPRPRAGRQPCAWPARRSRGAPSAAQECSGYWPAGTAAFHVNADIADAVRPVRAVDRRRRRSSARLALRLLVETARLWMSLGHLGEDGAFHIDGVTGPGRVQRAGRRQHLHQPDGGRRTCAARPTPPSAGPSGPPRSASTTTRSPAGGPRPTRWPSRTTTSCGVHEQDRGFTRHAASGTSSARRADGYPLLLHYPYFDLYRKQVVKQADLVLAMHWCGDAFTPRRRRATSPTTSRSPSGTPRCRPARQAVLAAEVGHLDLAVRLPRARRP